MLRLQDRESCLIQYSSYNHIEISLYVIYNNQEPGVHKIHFCRVVVVYILLKFANIFDLFSLLKINYNQNMFIMN